MTTELEAANNLLKHIMEKLQAIGMDCEDPIDIPDCLDLLIERAGLNGGRE